MRDESRLRGVHSLRRATESGEGIKARTLHELRSASVGRAINTGWLADHVHGLYSRVDEGTLRGNRMADDRQIIITRVLIPEALTKAWLQHVRDFDIAHPGCHFDMMVEDSRPHHEGDGGQDHCRS